MDGTLLDTMPVWKGLSGAYLRRYGVEVTPAVELDLLPLSLEQSARYFHERLGVARSEEEMLAEISALAEERYARTAKPKDGVPEYLAQCAAAGHKMCVATVTSRDMAMRALARFDLTRFFADVFTCDTVGFLKSNPLFFRNVAVGLGLRPDETAVFEDSFYCMRSAAAAGLTVIGVFDQEAAGDEAEARRCCHHYIYSFTELVESA
jgi:HAD superfamily hydrolase (TIGR01509 family)